MMELFWITWTLRIVVGSLTDVRYSILYTLQDLRTPLLYSCIPYILNGSNKQANVCCKLLYVFCK